MAKIVIEEFDCAHKFVDEVVRFLLTLKKRDFVEIYHAVGCDDLLFLCPTTKKNLAVKLETFYLKYAKRPQKVTFSAMGGKFTGL